jgi:30S ribosomal protein 3
LTLCISLMQLFNIQVLWLDNSLGFAINQTTAKTKVALTPFYFWPISDARQQIKLELESKSWLKESERFKILNLVIETMNRWENSQASNSQEKNITSQDV